MLNSDQLVAHRGLQRCYPENSLLALQGAATAGAKFIECDVQLSQDGVFFLCHDRDLNRLCGVDRLIHELTAAELLQLSLTEHDRFGKQFESHNFATLSEMVAWAKTRPDIHFYIELKRGALISHGMAYCLDILASCIGDQDNITILSFDRLAMKKAKEHGIRRAGIVLEHWSNKDEIIDYCEADIVFINKTHLHNDKPISASVPIAVYEVVDPTEATELLDRGANLIETFEIDLMLNA